MKSIVCRKCSDRLSQRQVKGIKMSIALGKVLRERFPNLLLYYTQVDGGMQRVVEQLDFVSTFGVSFDIALKAVYRAISGHNGEMGIEGYEGFVPDIEKRKRLFLEHLSDFRKRRGNKLYQSGRGIGSLSLEDLSRFGSMGGKISYEKGVGVHSLTKEVKRELGITLSLRNGFVPWSELELRRLVDLYKDSRYHRGERPNRDEIAKVLNVEFHDSRNVRSSNSVSRAIYKFRSNE